MSRLSLATSAHVALVLCASIGSAQTLVGVDDAYGVPYSEPLVVESPGVIENDTFGGIPAEDEEATVELVLGVDHGTLECDADPVAFDLCPDGSFTYTPNASFAGFDSFTYRVAARGQTSQATVTLTACTGGPTATVCWQESAYLAALGELGYSTFQEGLEDDAAWGGTREPLTAAPVLSLGISWASNHPASNGLTTGDGPARTGQYGVYDPQHGSATGTVAECNVDAPPTHCLYRDGFTGAREVGESTLYAAGGHLTGSAQANLVMILDGGAPIGLGKLSVGSHQFFGVIDTSGFTSFRFEEIDGKVGQARLVFGDDFVFATTPADTTPPQVTLVGSVADTGDGELSEGETTGVSITQLLVRFSEPVNDLGGTNGADSASNPANYLLVNDGGDGFETSSCSSGVAGTDTPVAVDWVVWETGSMLTSTVGVNGGMPLASGSYRLHVCASASIKDWAGNPLDGDGNGNGGDDFVRSFTLAGGGAPIAYADSYALSRGAQLAVTIPGVLDNDVGTQPLTAQLVSGPSHASSFVLGSDGSFSYRHDGLSVAGDSFTYRAYDGSAWSAAATVSLTVNPAVLTWFVDPAGSDLDGCLTPAAACASVTEAVTRAIDGDTIMIAAGTFTEHLTLNEDLALVGMGPAASVLDGGASGVVVSVDATATVTLTGLALRNGGAGGVASSGAMTMAQCWVHDNGDGGGGSFGGVSTMGSAWIEDSTISHNHGDTSGGIANAGHLDVVNSTVYANSATFAAGIYNPTGSTLSLAYSTVAANGAWGIRGGGSVSSQGTIVAGHSTANCGTILTTLGHNLEDGDSCGLDPAVGDLINTDPLLATLADNGGPTPTLALAATSPAVDAGGSAAYPTTDQRAILRPVDGDGDTVAVSDIGAFELDFLFADGFESGGLDGWSTAAGRS